MEEFFSVGAWRIFSWLLFVFLGVFVLISQSNKSRDLYSRGHLILCGVFGVFYALCSAFYALNALLIHSVPAWVDGICSFANFFMAFVCFREIYIHSLRKNKLLAKGNLVVFDYVYSSKKADGFAHLTGKIRSLDGVMNPSIKQVEAKIFIAPWHNMKKDMLVMIDKRKGRKVQVSFPYRHKFFFSPKEEGAVCKGNICYRMAYIPATLYCNEKAERAGERCLFVVLDPRFPSINDLRCKEAL